MSWHDITWHCIQLHRIPQQHSLLTHYFASHHITYGPVHCIKLHLTTLHDTTILQTIRLPHASSRYITSHHDSWYFIVFHLTFHHVIIGIEPAQAYVATCCLTNRTKLEWFINQLPTSWAIHNGRQGERSSLARMNPVRRSSSRHYLRCLMPSILFLGFNAQWFCLVSKNNHGEYVSTTLLTPIHHHQPVDGCLLNLLMLWIVAWQHIWGNNKCCRLQSASAPSRNDGCQPPINGK